MNTLVQSTPFAHSKIRSNDSENAYATHSQTADLLRQGQQYRRERLEAADMMTTEEAADTAGTSRVTINAWIKAGRCIGLSGLRRGYKLPRWQFEPAVWPAIQRLSKQLGAADGWQMLSFMESSQQALNGKTPRMALEQGASVEEILALAAAEAH